MDADSESSFSCLKPLSLRILFYFLSSVLVLRPYNISADLSPSARLTAVHSIDLTAVQEVQLKYQYLLQCSTVNFPKVQVLVQEADRVNH